MAKAAGRDTDKAANGAPETREQLLTRHAEARRKRNSAVLGSPEWEKASAKVARIEVKIAALERAMDPPRV